MNWVQDELNLLLNKPKLYKSEIEIFWDLYLDPYRMDALLHFFYLFWQLLVYPKWNVIEIIWEKQLEWKYIFNWITFTIYVTTWDKT